MAISSTSTSSSTFTKRAALTVLALGAGGSAFSPLGEIGQADALSLKLKPVVKQTNVPGFNADKMKLEAQRAGERFIAKAEKNKENEKRGATPARAIVRPTISTQQSVVLRHLKDYPSNQVKNGLNETQLKEVNKRSFAQAQLVVAEAMGKAASLSTSVGWWNYNDGTFVKGTYRFFKFCRTMGLRGANGHLFNDFLRDTVSRLAEEDVENLALHESLKTALTAKALAMMNSDWKRVYGDRWIAANLRPGLFLDGLQVTYTKKDAPERRYNPHLQLGRATAIKN